MAQECESGDHTLTVARLETILAGVPSGMLMVDREGRGAFANRFAARLFGYEVDELVGVSVDMLLPTSLQASHPGKREAFFLKPTPRAMGAGRDLRARRKDGSEFPVEIGLNPVETSEGLQVLASIVDISERLELAQAQRDHAARLEAVLAASPNGMLTVDEHGVIVYANPAVTDLFRYSNEELVGTSVDDLLPTSLQEGHPGERADFHRAPTPRAMGADRNLRARRKDGSEIPVEIGLNPVGGPEGLQVLASIVDISERVRAAAEQARLVEDVRQANRALEESNLELKEFAYIASHDLQTPLRGVSSFAEFLRQDYGESLDEQANEYIDRIVDGARRMKQLIDDLLTYSRVESQATPICERRSQPGRR